MDEQTTPESAPDGNLAPQPAPPWEGASVADLEDFNFEVLIAGSKSADAGELGEIYRAAAASLPPDAANGPAIRTFGTLAAVLGMHFKPQDPNEPFGPMLVLTDGRRSPTPADFRGPLVDLLAEMATRSKHPVLRARLADISWVIDRKRGQLGATAAGSYAEIVEQVDTGALTFRFDEDYGALKYDARDLLRRALFIGRGTGLDKAGAVAASNTVAKLRQRALEKKMPTPTLWFAHLDLDFGISPPADIGKSVEALIAGLPDGTDADAIANLWRLATRAYHCAKCEQDKQRCQSAAAEQLVLMAERQPSAMLASHILAEAITELHGVPGLGERRKQLRHRLIDVQAGIADEMSSFSQPIDLSKLVEHTEQRMQHPSLRDKLFVFAALSQSPDPAQLVADAEKSIRQHPLSSLFAASHHDREGKVVHRSAGAGLGEKENESAVQRQITQHESFRRHITAAGEIEVARQSIASSHYLADDSFATLLAHSPFVPRDTLMTYSRGFTRFFQGDFVSALYILTPLLENSLRYVLKSYGHDVTKFDDSRQTQEDRTISSLFEQMRQELDAIFGRAITTDIENVFLKKPGPYLRHSLSHGMLHDGDPYGSDALYGSWLIFHLCMAPIFPIRTQLTLPFDDVPQDEPAPAQPAPT